MYYRFSAHAVSRTCLINSADGAFICKKRSQAVLDRAGILIPFTRSHKQNAVSAITGTT
jgi:hypothetical protein